MKKVFLPSFVFLLSITSCTPNERIPLYNLNIQKNSEEKDMFLLPSLSKNQLENLIDKKASFPLIIFNPGCDNTCSLLPSYINIYLKNNNIFFPFVYHSIYKSVNNKIDDSSYIAIYNKGSILDKKEFTYFDDNEISTYLDKYSYKSSITVCNDLKYVQTDSNFNLATFINYKQDGESSFLNYNLAMNNNVLIVNDENISFDDEYNKIISDNKINYVFYSSYLNDDFYQDFKVSKNDNNYNILKYINSKFVLEKVS